MRRSVLERRHPILYIHYPLVDAAFEADYVPISRNVQTLAAAFVVRADSKFKALEDIAGSRVSWAGSAGTTPVAMTNLASKKILASLKINDVGVAGPAAAFKLLEAGEVDVAILRDELAARLIKERGSDKYRVVYATEQRDIFSWWVRRGAFTDVQLKTLQQAILSLERESTDANGHYILDSAARGSALAQSFLPPLIDALKRDAGEHRTLMTEYAAYAQFVTLPIDRGAAERNAALPGIARQDRPASRDPVAIREAILARGGEAIDVGWFPSEAGLQDSYQFSRSYLPLANYLSERMRKIVVPVAERDADQLRGRIVSGRYPILVLGAAHAAQAQAAGYTPVAQSRAMIEPAFVVRADAPIKTLADLGGKKVGWTESVQLGLHARAALLEAKVLDRVAQIAMLSASPDSLASLLQLGTADSIVLRHAEAERLVAQSGGRLRIVEKVAGSPAASVWARADVIQNGVAAQFVAALLGAEGDRMGHDAVGVFNAGFALSMDAGGFIAADVQGAARAIAAGRALAGVDKSMQIVTGDAKSLEESARRPVFYRVGPAVPAKLAQSR
jgi:ABC-type phosphate/phosphonate transport system substrate-binding protein